MSIVIEKVSHCWGSNVSADGSDEFLLTKGLLVVLLNLSSNLLVHPRLLIIICSVSSRIVYNASSYLMNC